MPTYVKYMVPGALLLAVYALLIPGFWVLAVYMNRHSLEVNRAAGWRAPRPGARGERAARAACQAGVPGGGWARPLRRTRAALPPRARRSSRRPPRGGAAVPQDPAVLAKYGFLYTNYSPRLPYWETTEMLRKFAIAFVPVSRAPGAWATQPLAPRAARCCARLAMRSRRRAGRWGACCAARLAGAGPAPAAQLERAPCRGAACRAVPGSRPPPQVFIPSNPEGSLQAAAAQVVLLVYICLTLKLWPFACGEDNWLQLASMTGAALRCVVLRCAVRRAVLCAVDGVGEGWREGASRGPSSCPRVDCPRWAALPLPWGCGSAPVPRAPRPLQPIPTRPSKRPAAVLWLLLLSAGINKWASLSDAGSRALAGGQLVLSSGVGFLLLFAIVRSGLGIARQLTRKFTARRKAARDSAVAEAEAGEPGAGGGGGMKRGSSAKRDSLASSLFDKRASMGSVGSARDSGADAGGFGEIAAARPDGGASRGASLATITVLAGPPPSPPPAPVQQAAGAAEPAGMPPVDAAGAAEAETRPGLLQRQLSSLTRRAAADDSELQLAVEGSPQASGPSIPGHPGRRPAAGSRASSSGEH